jgi:hypothetical protein
VNRCGWCGEELQPWKRAGTKTCSTPCRQALCRFRVSPASETATEPKTFAYLDPPYPGLAQKLYGRPEVDHVELVAMAERGFPDGWALSTSERGLPDVLSIVRANVRAEDIRVCAWIRGSRPVVSLRPRVAWEPLIVVRGRPRRLEASEPCDDVLLSNGARRQRSMPGALVGMKTGEFCAWLFMMLGAMRGDRLEDLFPGSGVVTKAWRRFAGKEDDDGHDAETGDRTGARRTSG